MWKNFKEDLKKALPQLVTEILDYKSEEKVYAIAFLTTDDFYGMYVAFETIENLKRSKYSADSIQWFANEWTYSDQELPTKFNKELYTNLVEVIDASTDIDLMRPSNEKWNFAIQFMEVIKEAIDCVPQSLFEQYGYVKDDIVFLATMSDGDYMDEMLLESAKRFNSSIASKEILEYLVT